MKRNCFEIKQSIKQALLCDREVVKINAIARFTGLSRNTIIKYLDECREDILVNFTKGFKKPFIAKDCKEPVGGADWTFRPHKF